MSGGTLYAPHALWAATWAGLRRRGDERRESACVWLGTRDRAEERACEVVFLDDLPGTVARRLHHRTSLAAVAALMQRARALGLVIVADIHTHPGEWVGLSELDQAHPIEYRVGLVALVLPRFASGPPELQLTGVHEYLGDGRWRGFAGEDLARRVCITEEGGTT